MLRKKTWIMGLLAAVLLTLSTGANGTTFNCAGGGGGTCTGDLCD